MSTNEGRVILRIPIGASREISFELTRRPVADSRAVEFWASSTVAATGSFLSGIETGLARSIGEAHYMDDGVFFG